MILRKPYAFLIKHFKLIHLILTILLAYIIFKTNKLFSFFDEYLSSKTYAVIDNLVNTYIGGYFYLAIFLVIIISIIVFLLMRKKDKPIRYYIITIVYYLILAIAFLFVSVQLENIGLNKIDVMLIKVCHDLLLVLFLAQIPFVLISLVRAVGFNIKKFNFQRDLMELQADDKDNEEFELDVDIDSDDVKTRFRRRFRIISYVLKENKLIVIALTGILLIVSGVVVQKTVYEKNLVYGENKTFNANGIEMTVLGSYQYNTDLFGNDISNNDKYSYTVARVKAKNITNNDLSIGLKNFTLKINKDVIYNIYIKQKNSFMALGTTSEVIKLTGGEEKIFIVIFRIDNEYQNEEKIMEYAGSYRINNGERIYNVNRIKLSAKEINEEKQVKTVKIGETLTFEGSVLNNTTVTIDSFTMKDKFVYSYKQCLSECYTFNDYIVPKVNTKYNMTIMKLGVKVDIDDKIYNNNLENNLIATIGHLRYVIDDKEYVQSFNIADITPDVVNDYKYFEIKKEARDADAIYLDFIILDKAYTYVLKEA